MEHLATVKYGTHCGQWECSHSQAISKGSHANLLTLSFVNRASVFDHRAQGLFRPPDREPGGAPGIETGTLKRP